MGEQSENDLAIHSAELLITEHRYLSESFWKNEEVGERRVNFFISLVSAVIAGLVVLATKAEDKAGALRQGDTCLVAIFALLSLLLLGIFTLLRLVRRDQVTDEYKAAMDAIREYFKDRDPRLRGYAPFPRGRKRKPGGLAHFMEVFNSLIFAAVAILSVPSGRGRMAYSASVDLLHLPAASMLSFGLSSAGHVRR